MMDFDLLVYLQENSRFPVLALLIAPSCFARQQLSRARATSCCELSGFTDDLRTTNAATNNISTSHQLSHLTLALQEPALSPVHFLHFHPHCTHLSKMSSSTSTDRNADGTFAKGSEAAKEAGHLGGLHAAGKDDATVCASAIMSRERFSEIDSDPFSRPLPLPPPIATATAPSPRAPKPPRRPATSAASTRLERTMLLYVLS